MTGGIAATLGYMAPDIATLTQMGAVMALGGLIGTGVAKKIQITDLPQLVAGFHRFIHFAFLNIFYQNLILFIK